MRPAGGAADLEDPIVRPRRQERQDASHTLALDPADEQARVIVETIESYLPTIASFHAWTSTRVRNVRGAMATTV